MNHTAGFESDKTSFVFSEVAKDLRFQSPGFQNTILLLEDAAKHYQLAVRSRKEFGVLFSKYALDQIRARNWKADGDTWIIHLDTIYTLAQNIRERAFALHILNSVNWSVGSKLDAETIISAVQSKYKSADRNPNRRWMDSVLTEHNVPSRKVLYMYMHMMALEYRLGLPNDIARLIISY